MAMDKTMPPGACNGMDAAPEVTAVKQGATAATELAGHTAMNIGSIGPNRMKPAEPITGNSGHLFGLFSE